MHTQTMFISFSKLLGLNGGVVAATVALVCNDLAIANSSLGHYTTMKSKALGHIRRGGRLYFARMHCGHLSEGMMAIKKIKENPDLSAIAKRCSVKAQEAFHALCRCLPGGTEHNNFDQYVGGVRNRVAFHYDPNDLQRAIEDRSRRTIADVSPMTAGDDIHSTRFEFGDHLLDSIVCRRLWRIPRNKDVREEADRIADWCDRKCREFLQFGQEFVPSFLRGRATVG